MLAQFDDFRQVAAAPGGVEPGAADEPIWGALEVAPFVVIGEARGRDLRPRRLMSAAPPCPPRQLGGLSPGPHSTGIRSRLAFPVTGLSATGHRTNSLKSMIPTPAGSSYAGKTTIAEPGDPDRRRQYQRTPCARDLRGDRQAGRSQCAAYLRRFLGHTPCRLGQADTVARDSAASAAQQHNV